MRSVGTAERRVLGLCNRHLVPELLSCQSGVARPEQLEQVVPDTDELSLAVHLFLPPEQELAEASRLLDLPEHRLAQLLPQSVMNTTPSLYEWGEKVLSLLPSMMTLSPLTRAVQCCGNALTSHAPYWRRNMPVSIRR